MNTAPASRTGFASIVALMMIALVGAAILAATLLLRADVKRTQVEARDAQLRQLIVAAARDVAAKRRGGTWPPASEYSLQVPASLPNAAVRVRVSAAGKATVIARIGDSSFEQALDPAP